MFNPFTTALGYSKELGFPEDSFDTPRLVEMNTPSYPEFTGVSNGPSAYRSFQDSVSQDWIPSQVGQYKLGFMNAPGIQPLGTNNLYQDLIRPRESNSVVGTDRIIQSIGPVSGRNSNMSGIQADLNTPNPNYSGPVTGGGDYSQILAANQQASLAIQISEMASASALIASI